MIHCTSCTHYQGESRPVGPCSVKDHLVVSNVDAENCPTLTPIASRLAGLPARSVSEDGQPGQAAANAVFSSFFEAATSPLILIGGRGSTADQSRLREFDR